MAEAQSTEQMNPIAHLENSLSIQAIQAEAPVVANMACIESVLLASSAQQSFVEALVIKFS